jgi:hypothetical protein
VTAARAGAAPRPPCRQRAVPGPDSVAHARQLIAVRPADRKRLDSQMAVAAAPLSVADGFRRKLAA